MNKKPKIYLVRHGPKQWQNGKKPNFSYGFNHDPPIKTDEQTMKIVRHLRKNIISATDNQLIITSPFSRCKHTAELLSLGLVDIKISFLLREYLGNWKNSRNIEVGEDLQKRKNLVESWSEFMGRIRNLSNFLSSLENSTEYDSFIIVTHQIIIDQILRKNRDLQQIVYYEN